MRSIHKTDVLTFVLETVQANLLIQVNAILSSLLDLILTMFLFSVDFGGDWRYVRRVWLQRRRLRVHPIEEPVADRNHRRVQGTTYR